MASKIPTIDFLKTELKPGSLEWELTKAQVLQALKEYGCFEAIYDKVPKEIGETMFDALKEAFPLESKVREFIDKPFDRNVVKSYSKSLMELNEMLIRMILESLGLKNYIDEFLDQQVFILRFMNYKKEVQGEDVSKPRLIGHTDTGFLTIVKQDQVGLQRIESNPSPDSFVILADDALRISAWTNDQIQSAFHRVTIAGDIERFSIMLFSSPKPGKIIEAPKEMVDEEHPILFKPFDIVGYIKYRMTGADNEARDALKTYCGV
ncbi:probable 2-oxoglutarate-dependent dioxygenase AOP1.2 [Lycium ferocissimum]|uniref:probable 2-oxoglutarate-dependent dioxygenase AOP1.2 n=1 Tax=Lycium ferocissimum TaxID=112874 RepID=UPI0028162072|nr:probable 2-oxoglutarate-dependent dioxygenase AOP1.2 [Lycium ferocissimum]